MRKPQPRFFPTLRPAPSRISRIFDSLAGLEKALAEGDAAGADLAVQRILMGHAPAFLNDHSFENRAEHADDSRRATPGLSAGHPTQILHPETPGTFAFRRAAPRPPGLWLT